MKLNISRFCIATLALLQLSCATGGLTPVPPSMPIARLGLAPEHRIFYDTLADYGSWVLIEPIGYVFRPRISFESWSPYGDGFWAPTDLYGWVWISNEPFGWATYHYGRWFLDSFQGWVWMPGTEWGPGWVTWAGSRDYIGWAPEPPYRYNPPSIPGGGYRFVQTAVMGSTDLKSHMVSADELGDKVDALEPIVNTAQVGGVRINRGPEFDRIQRVAGPLKKIEIEDLLPGDAGPASSKAGATPLGSDPAIADIQRAGEKAAREARQLTKSKGEAPERLPQLRPIGVAKPRGELKPRPVSPPAVKKPAPRDTTS